MFEVGDYAYLGREIVEPACCDHPAFLMGQKGERVRIVEKVKHKECRYLVEGPTNAGKPWYASGDELMRTKPIPGN